MDKAVSKYPVQTLLCLRCGYSWESNLQQDNCPICFYLEKIDKIIKSIIPSIKLLNLIKRKQEIVAQYDQCNLIIKIISRGHANSGIWIYTTKEYDNIGWSLYAVDKFINKSVKTNVNII